MVRGFFVPEARGVGEWQEEAAGALETCRADVKKSYNAYIVRRCQDESDPFRCSEYAFA